MEKSASPLSIKNLYRKSWVLPLLLAITLFVAYGFQVFHLGFYWDDWEDVFLYKLHSSAEFFHYFAYDRPTTIWVYLLFFPLFGLSPAKWQIFNLILRYLSILGLWWTFCQVWPRRKYEIGWLALLLAIFPGFFQQTISVTYSRHFAALALFGFSLVFSILAWRYRRWYLPFTLVAVIASFAQMMTIEYFVGLEVIRPFLFWVLFRHEIPNRRKRIFLVIKLWLPYVIPLLGFFAWRFFLFKPAPGTDDPNGTISLSQLRADPFGLILHLIQNILQDFIYLLVFIWSQTIDSNEIDLASKALWLSWIAGGVVALVAAWLLGKEENPSENPESDHHLFVKDWLILGGVSILAGGLPVWLTDRQIIVGQWSDRFSLGPMLGICLLVIVLIILLGYKRIQKSVLLGILLALSLSTQIRTVNRYRLNWDIQKDYYWQFFWRVPSMKPGTALFGTKMPFGLIADYSVSYAMNAIYSPDMNVSHIPYWFFSSMRAYGNDIPDFLPDLPVSYSMRNLRFTGSTSNGIVPHYKAGSACVRILKPEDKYSPFLTPEEVKLAEISNLDQILRENSDTRVSPEEIFGPEPEHDWCYFYQKADLARQYGDWGTIVELGDQAEKDGFSPAVGMEYEPFIEGYAHQGKWETAYLLTQKANDLTNNMGKTRCYDWNRREPVIHENDAASHEWADRVQSDLNCQQYGNLSD